MPYPCRGWLQASLPDLREFTSTKTGRGPLAQDWMVCLLETMPWPLVFEEKELPLPW